MKSVATQIIAGPAGDLEIAPALPKGSARGIALCAHPHPLEGGTMDNKVVTTLAKTFGQLNYATFRFNYRGVGRSAGQYDAGHGESEDALVVYRYAQQAVGDLPVVLAGFSFGGFVQVQLAQRVQYERLVLIAPAVKRFPVATVPQNSLIIHGDADDVVALADVLEWARPQHLPIIVFPDCGHFFHGRLLQLQQIITQNWHGYSTG